MLGQFIVNKIRLLRAWPIFMLLLLMALCGCQAKEPPLSPEAAAFKKEIQECLDRLCKGVVEGIVKGDVPAINETLKRIEPEAIKLCRMCPFRIGVLDKNGATVTVYPFKKEAVGDFSGYEVVVRTLKNQKINQQRFFLQDGSQIYIVCAPLTKQDNLVGILALSLSAEDAKNRWGLSEKDFLAIDFNVR